MAVETSNQFNSGPAMQQGQQPPMQAAGEAEAAAARQSLPIGGRFSNYVAPYLRLMLPLLTARYIVEGIERLNPKDMLKRTAPMGERSYLQKNFFALGWGAIASAVTGVYTYKTYKDIKTVFSEAAGYELGKQPQDITYNDMRRSKNPLLETTMGALVKRTAMRFATVFTLFLPWHLLGKVDPTTKARDGEAYAANSRMGTGIMASYLFMDSFTRKESLFEMLQDLINDKIHHNNGNPYDTIKTTDITNMLTLYHRSQNKAYEPPLPATEAAQENIKLATFVADKMNQTYGNTPNQDNVSLTLGKMLFLMGNGMLDHFPESMGYVELASHSSGMQAVKQASVAIKQGADPAAIFGQYGIELDGAGNIQSALSGGMHPSAPPQEQAATRFTDRVPQAQSRIPEAARTPQDFAAQVGTGPMLGH